MKQNNAKPVRAVLIMILLLMLAVMPALSGCGKKSGGEQDVTTASLPTEVAETEQAAIETEQEATTTTTRTTTTSRTTTRTKTQTTTQAATADYTFRNRNLLNGHYKKHGIEMGFDSPEEYLAAANAVIANPSALTKTEKEDGDLVFYVENTNEFVVLSRDGYIRTYFLPDSGKRYFDRQ